MQVIVDSQSGIQKALDVLRSGGVVAHATETCYGLACDLKNPEAVQRLFAIKNRPATQPVSALFASVDEAMQYLEWNEEAATLANKHLPGPLTIILKAKPGCALYAILAGCDSIGVRVSSHRVARELVKQFGSPLSTTSANIHGMPNPYSVEEIKNQYADKDLQPDLILDSGALPKADASTVIDVSQGTVNVLRKGDIDL